MKSKKQLSVFAQVEKLYKSSTRKMAHWMWNNHVQVVAQNAIDLTQKYGGDPDVTFAGALLHDLGDVWYERDDKKFASVSEVEAEKILETAGFTNSEKIQIMVEVIKPHSCHPDNFPQIIEGKIVATADALAHLKTTFYSDLKAMHLPLHIKPSEFGTWVSKKLDRDYHTKIFFEDIKNEVTEAYQKLKSELVI